MSRLSEIIEGWKNNLIPKEEEKEFIEAVHQERMNICNECPYISTKHRSIRPDVHCVQCGCTLAAKTRSFTSACPLNKWGAIEKDKKDE
jgi:hypothetical protein